MPSRSSSSRSSNSVVGGVSSMPVKSQRPVPRAKAAIAGLAPLPALPQHLHHRRLLLAERLGAATMADDLGAAKS